MLSLVMASAVLGGLVVVAEQKEFPFQSGQRSSAEEEMTGQQARHPQKEPPMRRLPIALRLELVEVIEPRAVRGAAAAKIARLSS